MDNSIGRWSSPFLNALSGANDSCKKILVGVAGSSGLAPLHKHSSNKLNPTFVGIIGV